MPKTSHITVLELVGREFQPVTVEIRDVDVNAGTFSYVTPDGARHSANPRLLYLAEALSTDFRTAWRLIQPLIDVPGVTLSLATGTVSDPHRLPPSEYDWSFVRDSSDNANALMISKIADSTVHKRMKLLGLWSADWVDNKTDVASLDRPRSSPGYQSPERREGSKFDRKLSVKEIAVRVRADIKAAIAAREIPAVKTSVRSDHNSIDIRIVSWPTNVRVLNPERVIYDHLHPNQFLDERQVPRLTQEGSHLLRTIESIREAYNYDASDAMVDHFDVNYYGGTQFDWEAERAERQAILRELPKYVPGQDAKITSGQFAGWYKIAEVYENEAGLNVELSRKGMEDRVVVNGADLALLQLME